MALTGHLSDLSLSELIEFFCNQRKTGCLSVRYPQGSGCFYLQSGSVVDAKIGELRGIDAVYYALTLPNAAFEFKGAAETPERSINQPWTQVVLEGLRRLDEGITPAEAFPNGPITDDNDNLAEDKRDEVPASNDSAATVPSFLSSMSPRSISPRKSLIAGSVAAAVLLSVAVIGVPAGWYGRNKPAASNQPKTAAVLESPPLSNNESASSSPSTSVEVDPRKVNDAGADAAALAARRQREKERAKLREDKVNAATENVAKPASPAVGQNATADAKTGAKRVTVQVSYDESGRVVQASGSDPTAIRIARQKHFPPGKAGTATITIPIN
jgi:hypothetical protein